MCTKVQGGCDALAHHPGSAALHILILASSLPPHMHLLSSFLEYLQQIPCYITCVCISENMPFFPQQTTVVL